MTEHPNADINTGVRVSWETKISESGIQIANGPSTIKREGVIIGSNLVQTPQGAGIILIIAGDDKSFHVVESGAVKIL